jgi:hypothetical protein
LNYIDLAQDRDQWWAPVNMVMNLQVKLNEGKFFRWQFNYHVQQQITIPVDKTALIHKIRNIFLWYSY